MPESGTYGSARGVPGNGHPYRKPSRAVSAELVSRFAGTPGANGALREVSASQHAEAVPRLPRVTMPRNLHVPRA